jgi:transcriptional regulator GlxA family with amidase domain
VAFEYAQGDAAVSSGCAPVSETLDALPGLDGALTALVAWIRGNLKGDLSVEALSRRTQWSSRQFSRRFKAAFGLPPRDYVERLRLDEACQRLLDVHQTVESIAASVGYASDDAFRRAFERRFGMTPGAYRRQSAHAME